MTPQELKNSILQLAIQGKLVEQRPEEGTAEELFAQIQKEKQRLIAEKKIKKEKPLPEITEDEKPFDIPESWMWVRLKQVASILYGYPFNSEKFNELNEGIPLIRIRDILSGVTKTFTTEVTSDNYLIYPGDMLVGMDGNFNVNFWAGSPAYLNQRVCKIRAISECLEQEFLYYYLPTVLSLIFKTVSFVTVKHLSDKHLTAMIVPLPPLAEQKRIVAKVEELLPYIDRYKLAWSKLEQFNSRFPEDMKKSLLQYAIQGKLVEQRPEEGTAEELFSQIQAEKQRLIAEKKIKKEKPLPEITEDEKPFDIPESWKWVRLRDIISVLGDGIHGTPQYDDTGKYFFINGNNLVKGDIVIKSDTKKVSYEEFKKYEKPLDENTILISINGTIGNYAFYNGEPVILGKSACYFSFINGIDKEYICCLLNTQHFLDYAVKEATQTTIKNVSLKSMRMLPVPLPPLAEQKRIVEKLEQLLPLCERLK